MSTKRRKRKAGNVPRNRDSVESKISPDPISRLPFFWIIAVLALTLLAYLPVLRFEFVYDDMEQVVKNTHVQSWKYLADYFTQSLWSHGDRFQVRFYRPLFLVWLRLNNAFWGLSPYYWHLTTLLSHVLATFLMYKLVIKLSKNRVAGVFSALFFGLHPIHIQVAAWISAVSESLLAASLLGSLVCYTASVSRKTTGWLAGSLVLYASALLLKETAIVFPAIIFVYAWLWCDPKRQAKARIKLAAVQTLPFGILTIAYLSIRTAVLHAIVTDSAPMSASTLFFSLPSIMLTYIKLLLLPTQLSPMYASALIRSPDSKHFFVPFLSCCILAAGLSFLIWYQHKHAIASAAGDADRRLLLFSLIWVVLFMLLALYLPALQEDALIQDRYLYLPSIGLAMAAGLALASIDRDGRRLLGIPWVQILSAAVLTALMAVGIRREVYVWSDNISLFTRAITRSPESKIARHDLAAAFLDAGRYDEGIALLRKLLNEDPSNYVDNNNLGQAYLNKGDRADAEGFLAKSCQAHPTAHCLYQLGAVRFNLGQMEVSEQAFREAIALNPSAIGYHYAQGLALERLGNQTAALDAFQTELSLNPGDAQAKAEIVRLRSH